MKFLKEAIKEAEKSIAFFKIGAIIFKGNRILSRGYNKIGTTSKRLHPKFMKLYNSIHAEQSAILNARIDLKGACMIVVRINKAGKLANAKPCNYCMKYIKYVELKKVYYTNKIGDISLINIIKEK